MSVTAKVLFEAKQAEATQTTQYTAPSGTRTIVDKFTATNGSASNATLSINLLAPSGTAGAGNLVVKTKTLMAGETYTFPEIVGQVLEAGGMISTLASVAAAIVIRSNGREVTQ